MNRTDLIAYASAFASHLLASPAGPRIDRIILFGSVARGDFDAESDIDLFIDAPAASEPAVRRALQLFEVSAAHRSWSLRGLRNPLSLSIGPLDRWALRRTVLSSGILLYGKLEQAPKEARAYLLVTLRSPPGTASKRVRLWRALYGYTQRSGGRTYQKPGLVAALGGARLERGVFLVPSAKKAELQRFLRAHRLRARLYEIWSDAFA